MQAAASIALLLMSVSTQPGMAQRRQPPQTQTNPTAPGASAGRGQRDADGHAGPATGSGAEADRSSVSARYTCRLHATEEPFLESDRSLYGDRCTGAVTTQNTPRLDGLLRDGKIYLSLSDAVTLALENNYDIAIARYNLDIADTDILRTRGRWHDTRCIDGACDQYARWHNHTDDYKRRRSGRNNEWSGWWWRRVSGDLF